MSARRVLFESEYFAFFEDGTFGHSDGVGYIGETEADDVRKLYEVMQEFFASNSNPVTCAMCRTDYSGNQCPNCGSTIIFA